MFNFLQAGNDARDDVVSQTIQLIAETNQLQAYTVQKFFRAVEGDQLQQPLVQVAGWCIGEYGEYLVSGQCEEDEPEQVSGNHKLQISSSS